MIRADFALGLLCSLALAGCAANSAVAPMGPNSFMVSRQAATGFSGAGTLKEEALTEAGQFCTGRRQTIQVTDLTEAQPPYVMGNFPRVTVQFTCV
jgi:hypothetical protein